MPFVATLALVLLPLYKGPVFLPVHRLSPETVVANDNRAFAGRFEGGMLALDLEARTGFWRPQAEDGPGVVIAAFGERGKPLSNPGPLIRVVEGTEIRVTIHNKLEAPLTVYGLHTRPGSADDSMHVSPEATREVRFVAGAPGTYYYWATATEQPVEGRESADDQLHGAVIVDAKGAPADDRVFVIGRWTDPPDSSGPEPHGFRRIMTINGKSWPQTERLTYRVGEQVRWRVINPTGSSHPMHLHGFYYRVDSRGRWAADTVYAPAQRRLVNTELMLPGGTMAVEWVPERPGNWIFHCHFAFHISTHLYLSPDEHEDQSSPHGANQPHPMAGLVLGIYVEPSEGQTTPAARDDRPLRLLLQQKAHRFGEHAGYGFVLDDGGGAMIASDSIQIPGPSLILERGKPVAVTIVNRLDESAGVHWHGIELESFPDGVPGWSGTPGNILPPVAPGDSITVRFTPPRAGTFIYHSHANEFDQINAGLYGPLIVVEPGGSLDPETNHVIIVGGGGPAPTPDDDAPALVNGSPAPERLVLDSGRTYRLRLINIHSDWRVTFTLEDDAGFATWRPIAKDGADLPPEQARSRPAYLLTGPGETADFEFTPPKPGEYRLEIKSQLAGWHIPLPIHVREGSPTGR